MALTEPSSSKAQRTFGLVSGALNRMESACWNHHQSRMTMVARIIVAAVQRQCWSTARRRCYAWWQTFALLSTKGARRCLMVVKEDDRLVWCELSTNLLPRASQLSCCE
jgi:hypothetical protein